jgi:hypothetical protein
MFTFTTSSGLYAFYQDSYLHVESSRKINTDASLGDIVNNLVRTQDFFSIAFPFSYEGQTYYYGQTNTNSYGTQGLYFETRAFNSDGTFSDQVIGSWHPYCDASFVLYADNTPYLYSRINSTLQFTIQNLVGDILEDFSPVITGTSSVRAGPAISFPTSGDVSYFLLQDNTALDYKVFAFGDSSGNKYGPYAYLFVFLFYIIF